MKVNGESIYATRPIVPFREGKVCLTQSKNGSVYAIYLADENEKEMPSMVWIPAGQSIQNIKVSLLGSDATLKWEASDDGILVYLPESLRMNPPCDYAWVFRISKI